VALAKTFPPVRVLVADDDARVRCLVEAVLGASTGLVLVGCARDGFEAVRLFSELRPDAVLLDVVMPRCDGIEATKRILALQPDARVIAMTSANDTRLLGLCLDAGAKGCLRKDAGAIQIVPLMLALATSTRRPEPPGIASGQC
jgi:CheY-like chemotaxis protein